MDFIALLPDFGGVLWTVLSFVVVLSVIVFIHEYGHYIVGRWCGIRAEVFSMGFGPVLTSWTDRRGTRWQIAALPFGGYVRFLGDADASSRADPEALARMDPELREHTMLGAKLWKRALTVAAGPLANFILSTALFSGTILVAGVATEDVEIGRLKPLPPQEITLKPGDVITAINDVPITGYGALYDYARDKANIGPRQVYTVTRDGATVTATGPFPLLPLIDAIQPRSAAIEAGLRVGDLILSVDDRPITAFAELQEIVAASAGRELRLKVWRPGRDGAGEILEFRLKARVVDLPDGKGGFTQRTLIGITGGLFFEPRTVTPGPLEALSFGLAQTGAVIGGSLSGLVQMLKGAISPCNLQGPVGIARTSGDAASQGIGSFIWFIAVLSTAIGLLNLFPIPVLDGGHLVFFAYEAVVGRPPSDRAVQALFTAGLVLILGLMLFALGNDLFC